MPKYIGRRINVWFWIEATRGTAVAVQNWQPKTEISFENKVEVIQDESSIGVIADTIGSEVVRKFGEGDISGNIGANSIGYLLLSLLGSVTSTNQTGSYLHEFTLAESNSTQSLTIGVNDPVVGDKAFSLAMIDSMTISANAGEYCTFSVSFKSRPEETTTHTVSYAVDTSLLAKHSIFKTASNLAGLPLATQHCVQSFEITFSKNLEDVYCISSTNVLDFVNTKFGVEGSFTAFFDTTAFRDYQNAGTDRAIRFQLIDTTTTIGTANPSLTIDLPLASLTEFSRSMGNDEVVTQTCTFKGMYSVADGSIVDVSLVNTTSAYTA
jgi:hypothetical protein